MRYSSLFLMAVMGLLLPGCGKPPSASSGVIQGAFGVTLGEVLTADRIFGEKKVDGKTIGRFVPKHSGLLFSRYYVQLSPGRKVEQIWAESAEFNRLQEAVSAMEKLRKGLSREYPAWKLEVRKERGQVGAFMEDGKRSISLQTISSDGKFRNVLMLKDASIGPGEEAAALQKGLGNLL